MYAKDVKEPKAAALLVVSEGQKLRYTRYAFEDMNSMHPRPPIGLILLIREHKSRFKSVA